MSVQLTDLSALEKFGERAAAGQRSKVLREQWARNLVQLDAVRSQMSALIAEIRDNGGSVTGAAIYSAQDLADANSAALALIDDLVEFANTLPGVTAARG